MFVTSNQVVHAKVLYLFSVLFKDNELRVLREEL